MNSKRYLLLFASTLMFAGCASEYQPEGMTGGYGDKPLAPGSYRVTFSGNGYMTLDKARDLALLRAAEVTLAHGYSHFSVVSDSSKTTEAVVGAPATTVAMPNGALVTFPGQTSVSNKPFADLTIRCSKGKTAGSHDAETLKHDLKAKHSIK